MNLIEAARNLFKPIEHEVIAEGMLLNDKHYEDLILRRDELELIKVSTYYNPAKSAAGRKRDNR